MTNPNDAVGTNAGYNGRTTPNAFNDILALFTAKGIITGWACSPKSGMTVQLGGDGSTRDVAIAEDNAGNRTTINNRSGSPVDVTIDGAPASNNRIDAIVAYVENPQLGAGSTDTDFPSQTGLIVVKGTVAATPSAPNETAIRTAITADGATGGTAYFVVLATVYVGTGVTSITSGNITAGATASIPQPTIADGSITTAKLAASAVTNAKIANGTIEAGKFATGAVPTFTLQTTDPGEGSPLAANSFTGVYQ